ATATDATLTSARMESGAVVLEAWAPPSGPALMMERRESKDGWTRLAPVYGEGSGRIQYRDASVRAGTRYSYRLVESVAGRDVVSPEISIDVPLPPLLAVRVPAVCSSMHG